MLFMSVVKNNNDDSWFSLISVQLTKTLNVCGAELLQHLILNRFEHEMKRVGWICFYT